METVYAGGTDLGALINGNSDATQQVFGYASGVTVSDGEQLVEGGTAVSTTLSHGFQSIYEGTASGTTILSGGQQVLVEAGAIAVSTTISGGYQEVNGGVASGTTILSGGREGVFAGGTANGTTVSNGGTLTVDSGGLADPTTISSGGSEIVSSGGTDDGAQISGGTQDVYGYASGATVFTGSQVVEATGVTSGTIVSGGLEIVSAGGTDLVAQISGGEQDVYGSASGATIFTGSQVVEAGGTASGTVVSGGGTLFVASGGLADPTTISSGGAEIVSSGGTDDGAQISAGTQLDYGLASGAIVYAGSQVVEAGGIASSTTISAGAEIVSAGGSDLGAQISGGEQDVYGYASGATVFTGSQVVEATGVASGTIVSGGLEIVSAGGTDEGAQISGGTQFDYGLASGAIVYAGSQVVEAGGIASSTTISAGAEIISAGGSDFGAQISGGEQDVYGLASGGTVFTGSVVVESGGVASGTFVSNVGAQAGLQNVLSGGTAVRALIEFGSQTVASGGTASASQIFGTETVSGISISAVLHAGEQDVFGTALGATLLTAALQTVHSGGTASGSVVGTQAAEEIQSGGVGLGTVLQGSLAEQDVLGFASGTIVSAAGTDRVFSGGTDVQATVSSGGSQAVYSGGMASSTTVSSGGTLFVLSGGLADPATILSAGTEIVSGGGTDLGALISGTQLDYGYASGATIFTGSQVIESGGTASGTIISGGSEIVSAGTDDGAQISGGEQLDYGLASGAAVFTGSQVVESGGLATGITLSGGTQIVESGGTADGIVIKGGTADLTSGAVVSGAIAFAGSGTLALGGSGGTLSAFMSGLVVSGLAAGDTVDLTNVASSAGAAASLSGDILDITVGGTTYALNVTSTFAGERFFVSGDGGTGTDITVGALTASHTVSAHSTYYYSGATDFGDIVDSGGTMIITAGGVATSTTVAKGGILIIEAGGTAVGLINSGTVDGFGGVVIGENVEPVINDGIIDPMNSYLAIIGDVINNSTILASATGKDGYAQILISGGTLFNSSGLVEAIATSTGAQAIINLEDEVLGGKIVASGNAQIYLDGGSISGGSLRTNGAAAEIGVFGGGTATVTSTIVSKGSNIFDDGTLTFSGGTAQAGVTFEAYGTLAAGGALTLSATTIGAKDHLIATDGGVLNISAASGGTSVFSAGTIVSATAGGTVDIYGGVANSGTIKALALGGVGVSATVNISGGTGGTFTNAKGALVEAEAISGYDGRADVYISAGGAVVNSGTMVASAGVGDGNHALLTVSGGTFTNAKGATVAEIAAANGHATADIFGSASVTNLGTIKGTASHDSRERIIGIETSGGTIANSGTISVAATTSSFEGLTITDNNFSGGSLLNAKGATIAASATTGSTADFYVEINDSGTISNSGSILFAANNDSHVGISSDFQGGAVVNSGTIDTTAANNSDAYNGNFDITGSAGGLTNSGTIDAIATNDSTAKQDGSFFGSGSLVNTGTMRAVATAGSTAYEGWDMNSHGGNLSNAKTMGASATTHSTADFYVSSYANGTNTGTIAATATAGSTAYAEFDHGRTFTNTKTVTASETGSSYADTQIEVYGSGGSGALINNTSAMTAVGNTLGRAELTLDAYNSGAAIDNTGTITATAIAGATASAHVYVDGTSASIDNGKLMAAIASGSYAILDVEAAGTANTITNTKTIEAVANGGTAYTAIGGDGFPGAVVNNTSGTLLATETAGTAFVDLGNHGNFDANVSGGTLKTVGANAYLGVIDGGQGSATSVTIAANSHIVGWDFGILSLTDIIGSISAGTLVQGARSGEVDISGNVSNSGTIEALGSYNAGSGDVVMEGGTGGSITNSGTIKASVTSGYYTDAAVSMSAGTVTNAKNGIIEALATNESPGENYVDVYGSTRIVNSGAMLASASNSSDDLLAISGGTVTNATTGKIEAIATNQSNAYADIYGSTTNAGLIEASGGADSEAGVYLSGTVDNSGGTILAIGNGAIYLGDGDRNATVTSGTLKTVGSEAVALVTGFGSSTLSAVNIASGSRVLAEFFGALTLENGTVIGNNKKGTDAASVVAYSSDGSVVVSGTVYNSGILAAGGAGSGTVTVTSGATVSGNAVQIDEFGTVVVSAGGNANVAFGSATSGTLEIADSAGNPKVYGGTVSGWGGVGGEFPGQIIELANGDGANYTSYTATYSLSGTPFANPNLDLGTLTVTSGGGTAAEITLEGNYVSGATFTVFNDGGNIGIYDPTGPATLAGNAPTTLASTAAAPPSLINYTGASNVALLGSYMASMFASPEGSVGNLTTQTAQNQAVLAHPHAT